MKHETPRIKQMEVLQKAEYHKKIIDGIEALWKKDGYKKKEITMNEYLEICLEALRKNREAREEVVE